MLLAWSPDVVFQFNKIPRSMDVLLSDVYLRSDSIPAKNVLMLKPNLSVKGNFIVRAIKDVYLPLLNFS